MPKEITSAVDRLQYITGADLIRIAEGFGRTHVAWSGNYERSQAWYPSESQVLKGIYSEKQIAGLTSAVKAAFSKGLVECASPEAATFRKFSSDLRIPLKVSRSPVDDVVLLERTKHEGVVVLWKDERGNLDDGGRLLCRNENEDLVAGSTNFAALGLGGYERGAELKAASRQRAEEFLSTLPALDLSATGVSLSGEPTIMDTIAGRYKAVLPEVDTLEEVESLKRDLRALRGASPLESLGEVFDPAERIVQERESELLGLEFEDDCKRIKKALQAKQPDTAAILEGMGELRELRSRWTILDAGRREEVSKRLAQIQNDVDAFLKKNAGQSVEQAREALALIEKVLGTCSSSDEVNASFDSRDGAAAHDHGSPSPGQHP